MVPLTGISYGNEKKTIAKISHATAIILTLIPARLPMKKGPWCMVLRPKRTLVRIGIR